MRICSARLSEIARLSLLFLVLTFLLGCQDPSMPQGVAAKVNGELIYLSSVQSLLDSRSASSVILPRPTVADLRASYRGALTTLIAHALVRQELAERGLAIDDERIDAAVSAIKSEYGPENFEDLLVELSLREDDWRQLIRDHLALEIFTTRILLPAVKIPVNEIRAYYETHTERFSLPAYGRICFVETDSMRDADDWCANVIANAAEPGSFAQCVDSALKDLPETWGRQLPAPGKCGKIIEQEGKWRTVALVSRQPATKPLLSEVYGLIENILLAEKRQAAFETWFAKKLASSRVRVNPDLFQTESESEF